MQTYQVKSFTDPNKTYTVRWLDDGSWRCDCPMFIFHEKDIIVCKHIIRIIKGDKSGQKNQGLGTSQKET